MKMYRWTSERFCEHFYGDIIVLAKDVEEARRLALKEYRRQFGKSSPYADYADYIENDYKRFKDYIAQTPTEPTVVFMYMSS